MKNLIRTLAAGAAAGFIALSMTGCFTMGQFSELSDDIEPLSPTQFQFAKQPYYTFEDVVARAMVGTTERDCEYFVIAGPTADTYSVYSNSKLRAPSRKVYVVTCYPDAATAPAGAVSVKTQRDRDGNMRPLSPIYAEIGDQRKVRSMRP